MNKLDEMPASFKVTDVNHHRNSVDGKHFYCIRFSFDDEGTFKPNMFAVVPDVDDWSDIAGVECFIVNLSDPLEMLLGCRYNFKNAVAAAIVEHRRESESHYRAFLNRG